MFTMVILVSRPAGKQNLRCTSVALKNMSSKRANSSSPGGTYLNYIYISETNYKPFTPFSYE